VPVVLVTGDDLTGVDAGKYAPDAVTVAVKTCVDRYSAICLPTAVSAARIREGGRMHVAPLVAMIPGLDTSGVVRS